MKKFLQIIFLIIIAVSTSLFLFNDKIAYVSSEDTINTMYLLYVNIPGCQQAAKRLLQPWYCSIMELILLLKILQATG